MTFHTEHSIPYLSKSSLRDKLNSTLWYRALYTEDIQKDIRRIREEFQIRKKQSELSDYDITIHNQHYIENQVDL